MSAPIPDSPIGRTGVVGVHGHLVRVKVCGQIEGKVCRCGGPTFDIEVLGTQMVGSAQMIVGGSRVEGCTTDILFDQCAP